MQGVTNPMDEGEALEAQRFKDNLIKLHAEDGNTSFRIPQIGGKELDVYKLYTSVTSRGGYEKVTVNKDWKNIVHEFDLPASCTSASFTLKHHYVKYLLHYERKHFSGLDYAPISSARSLSAPVSEYVPRKYGPSHSDYLAYGNYVASVNAASKNAVTKRVKVEQTTVESKRLVLAFESHLSAEINWALNTLSIFSCNVGNPFLFENNTFLLDSISSYLHYCALNVPCLHFSSAKLGLAVGGQKDRKLGAGQAAQAAGRSSARLKKTEQAPAKGEDEDELQDLDLHSLDKKCIVTNRTSDIEVLLRNNTITPFELLRAKRKRGVNGLYETVSELQLLEYIKQILLIIRNLSYIKANEHYIMKCSKLVEILLGLFSSYADAEVTTYSLECICNISKHVILSDYKAAEEFLKTLMECLTSANQSTLETAIETFRRLSLSSGNEEYLEKMPPEFLKHLVNLMVSPSPEVREAALEILCPISDRKIVTKLKIAKEPHCIKRLVGLLCSSPETEVEMKIAKLAALTLANLSLAPAVKDQLMVYEPEIMMVASSDKMVTDIVCNMLAELDMYQLTKPHSQT